MTVGCVCRVQQEESQLVDAMSTTRSRLAAPDHSDHSATPSPPQAMRLLLLLLILPLLLQQQLLL